jgi:hypothetical protein
VGLVAAVALLRPCTTSAGFTVTPDGRGRVDMAELRRRLSGDGYTIVIDARIILIVRKGVESSCYDTGKVLLKTTDRDAAERAFAGIEPHLAAATR